MSKPRFKGWPVEVLGAIATINERPADIRLPPGKKPFGINFRRIVWETSGRRARRGRLELRLGEMTRQTPPAGSSVALEGDVLLPKQLSRQGMLTPGVVSGLGGSHAFVAAPLLHVIRPGRRLTTKWLWHFLRQPSLAGSVSRGSGAPGSSRRITPQELRALPIPLPPVAAQKRIVGLLDQVTDARRLQWKSAAGLESALTAAFSEIFGDVERNPKGWKRVQLSALVERVEKGGAPGTSTMSRPAIRGEYGLLKTRAVSSDRFLPEENYALATSTRPTKLRPVAKGDLLMAWMGERESVGATAIVEDDYDGLFLPDTLWRLVPMPGVDIHFLKAFLSAPETRRQMRDLVSGSFTARLPRSFLNSLPAFVPPGAAQARFADLYRTLAEARALQDELGTELNRLLDAILSRAYVSRPQTAAKTRAKKASAKKDARAKRKRAPARSAEDERAVASAASEAESRTVWGKLSDFQRAVWEASLKAGQQFRVSDIMRAVSVPADTSADRERFLSALEVLVSLGAIMREGRLDADRWRQLDPESDREVGL